jgi:hypothetical protein
VGDQDAPQLLAGLVEGRELPALVVGDPEAGVCGAVAVGVDGGDAARLGEDLDDAAVLAALPLRVRCGRSSRSGTALPTGAPMKFSV